MKDKENVFIDLTKCSTDEQEHIFSVLPAQTESAQYVVAGPFTNLHLKDGRWVTDTNTDGKSELTYPEFIKLFEGGEGESTNSSVGWIDAQEEQPLCVSTGDWDGKQSDIVLAETFTGKKFLAQCYEGFMDGSKFYDWYQVDEINSNDWLITESVSRWMKIPF